MTQIMMYVKKYLKVLNEVIQIKEKKKLPTKQTVRF